MKEIRIRNGNVQLELLINGAIPRERSLWSRYEVNAVVESTRGKGLLFWYRDSQVPDSEN